MHPNNFSAITVTIQEWVERGYYPGASLLVANREEVLYERYFGSYNQESAVYIASAGKWMAAAAIAALVDEGTLRWEDTVSQWLPDWSGPKGQATLQQLLSHTAGYPDYLPAPGLDNYGTLTESLAEIEPLRPMAEPGALFHYGGLSMQVAGRMAELATGMEWEALFQEKIAVPLEMTNTHFWPVDPLLGHNPMIGGGARSTLPDYANFLDMLSHTGVFKGRRLLSAEAITEMEVDHVRGATVRAGEYVEKARGGTHHGIYGLGQWREILDWKGQAVLLSSPSWAGTYPWIDKRRGIYGIFLAHVEGEAAGRDGFNAFLSSPVLAMMIGEEID